MTTANKITICRILLVPFFITQVLYYVDTGGEWYRWLAIASFAVAALSDAVDGYIARQYNQHSELGKILDPLADKLLLVSGVVVLSFNHEPYLHRIPIWLAATIVSRDVLLVLGFIIIYYTAGKPTVQPVLIGKIATCAQMACVLWALLKLGTRGLFGWAAAAALFTGVSGLIYIVAGVRQLSTSPSSSATPQQRV